MISKILVIFLLSVSLAACNEQPSSSTTQIISQTSAPIVLATPTPVPTPSPTPIKVSAPDKKVSGSEIVATAENYVGQREVNGPNRSAFIDKINKFAGAPLGSPYCASFTSYVLWESGVHNSPRTAWSPSMVGNNNVPFERIEPGDVFGLYFASKKRIAHVGFINDPQYRANYILTTEANTSPTAAVGSEQDRNGDGIFSKIRSKKLLSDPKNKFSRYR